MNDTDIIYVIFRRDTLKVLFILNDEDECIEAFKELEDTPATQGMIAKVKHLVKVENV